MGWWLTGWAGRDEVRPSVPHLHRLCRTRPNHSIYGTRHDNTIGHKGMKTRKDRATEKFLSGYNCAQAVLWSFCDMFGIPPDTALKIACGLGAGMARRQEVCGAVTGGILVLGLAHGRGDGEERTATELTYNKTQELMRRFEAKHGTCNCRQLLDGCDIATEEGRKAFVDRDLLNRTCNPCVQTVVAILEEMTKSIPNQASEVTARMPAEPQG